MTRRDDAVSAGRLLQWALRPKALPYNEPEYRELIRRYEDDSDFRALTQGLAEGLGLIVLMANDRGLFLGSEDESVFALMPSEFRSGVAGDDRLLDGLIQLALAATIFPRQRDLEDDVLEARPPVTVPDVDATLRELVEVLKHKYASEPGAEADREDQGLWEAWRVYDSRPTIRQTANGRAAPNSMHRLIHVHMERLVELGCCTADRQHDPIRYRPTLRYQVLVQQLAATRLYRCVQDAMEATSQQADQPAHLRNGAVSSAQGRQNA